MSMPALAIAVRDTIRADPNYGDKHCNVEFDERAPATAPQLYIIVTFGSHIAGENNEAGQLIHGEYGIDVAVALRSPVKPRDRKRDLWIESANSFRFHEITIVGLIHFRYDVITAANVLITSQEGGTPCGFYKPLSYNGAGPIREAPSEIFAGVTGETQAALIQTLRFRGAMRQEVVS
jgi:hypothetical protein